MTTRFDAITKDQAAKGPRFILDDNINLADEFRPRFSIPYAVLTIYRAVVCLYILSHYIWYLIVGGSTALKTITTSLMHWTIILYFTYLLIAVINKVDIETTTNTGPLYGTVFTLLVILSIFFWSYPYHNTVYTSDNIHYLDISFYSVPLATIVIEFLLNRVYIRFVGAVIFFAIIVLLHAVFNVVMNFAFKYQIYWFINWKSWRGYVFYGCGIVIGAAVMFLVSWLQRFKYSTLTAKRLLDSPFFDTSNDKLA